VEPLKTGYAKQQEATNAFNAKYKLTRSTIADIPDNLRTLLDSIESNLTELPVIRSRVAELDKMPLSVANSATGCSSPTCSPSATSRPSSPVTPR
jgi:hypothetical protein